VGSTFNTVRDRFKQHKQLFIAWEKNKTNFCSVFSMFEKHGFDNCRMILIKEYEVCNRRHLEIYETLWMKKLKSINKIEPCGGLLKKKQEQQWRERNKDHLTQYFKNHYEENCERIKEREKQYYEKNKERIKKREKQFYEKNKEMINENRKPYEKQYREANKEHYKKYREVNKEHLKQINKEYREANRESINQKKKHTIECDCGRQVTAVHLARHKKTKVHIELMNAKTQ
jgi:hypothetical protein